MSEKKTFLSSYHGKSNANYECLKNTWVGVGYLSKSKGNMKQEEKYE